MAPLIRFLLGVAALLMVGGSIHAQDQAPANDVVSAPTVQAVQATIDDSALPNLTSTPALSALQRQMGAMQAELSALQQRVAEDEMQLGRRRSTDILRDDSRDAVSRFPKAQLTGVIQVDSGWFTQSAASTATFGDLQDTTGFRRARLAAFGDVAENVSYLLEMDFAAPGHPSFMDVWMDIHNIPVLGNIRIGQWRQPFHMDVQTSVREITFLEASLSAALAPIRQIGIGFHDVNSDQTATWAASAFRYPTDIYGNTGSRDALSDLGDRGYGASTRLTGLFWYDQAGAVLHLGAGYAYLVPGDGVVNYRTPPEFGGPFIGSTGTLGAVPFFAETGAIGTKHVQLYGAELGVRLGTWYGQAETTYAVVEEQSGNTLVLPGAYGQLAWLMTGEVRPYNRTAGVFGRVQPLHDFGREGWGAWELAARYSYLDLNEASLAGPLSPGGRLTDVTFGVNWYLNKFSKLQFNYIHAMLDRPTPGNSDTSIFAVRAQVDF